MKNILLFVLVLPLIDCSGKSDGSGAPAPSSPPLPAFHFDMGTATSPLATGFTRVTASSTYSAAQGFGWTAPPAAEFTGAYSADVPTNLDPALIADGVTGAADITFRADLPYASALVVAILGTPAAPRERLDIMANGTEVVSNAFTRVATMKAQFTNSLGAFKRVVFKASGSPLDLTFHCDGDATSQNAIQAISIYPDVAFPIEFVNGQLVASVGELQPAVDALNAHDYAAAQTLLDAVTDPIARADGYLWLIGWLTGDEIEIDPALLTQARLLLDAAPPGPVVDVLRQDARDFERGWSFYHARGYTQTAVPVDNLGSIVKNLSAAAHLLEQIGPSSPLHFEARLRIAINHWSRDTIWVDATQTYDAYWINIINQELVSLKALFPKSAELRVFQVVASPAYTTYIDANTPSGINNHWNGIDVPDFDPAQAWWAPYTEVTVPAGLPAWADAQRRYWSAFRRVPEWWTTRRLIDLPGNKGEIGGGAGDDVEAAWIGLGIMPLDEGPEVGAVGLTKVLNGVLFGSDVNQQEAFFNGIGDIEHTLEYTSKADYFLMPMNPTDPIYLDFATKTMRNMDETQDSAPWSTYVPATNDRHFFGYHIGSAGWNGPPRDFLENIGAVLPGFHLIQYNGAPRCRQMLEEWARMWAVNAMTAGAQAVPKPLGILPHSVNYLTSPLQFGTGGNWWLNGGYDDLPGGIVLHAYGYGLLRAAYEQSTAPDREIFLKPVLNAAMLVYDWQHGAYPSMTPGGPGWAASTLKSPIADALAMAKAHILADPVLGPTANVTKIDWVINANAGAYLAFANTAAAAHQLTSMADKHSKAHKKLRYFWPLATSAVSYTDRIGASYQDAHHLILQMAMGGPYGISGPEYTLQWFNPDLSMGPLELAALVTSAKSDALDVQVANCGTVARTAGLRLLKNLQFGIYDVTVAGATTSFTFDAKGAALVLPPLAPGVMTTVQLRLRSALGVPPLVLPDPAISAQEIVRTGPSVSVTVRNVGAADAAAMTIQAVQDGVVVSSAPVGAIGTAVHDLTPKPVVVALTSDASKAVTIRLVVVGAEITAKNNEVTVP